MLIWTILPTAMTVPETRPALLGQNAILIEEFRKGRSETSGPFSMAAGLELAFEPKRTVAGWLFHLEAAAGLQRRLLPPLTCCIM